MSSSGLYFILRSTISKTVVLQACSSPLPGYSQAPDPYTILHQGEKLRMSLKLVHSGHTCPLPLHFVVLLYNLRFPSSPYPTSPSLFSVTTRVMPTSTKDSVLKRLRAWQNSWVMLHEADGFVRLPGEQVLYRSPPRTTLALQTPNTYPGKDPLAIYSSTGCVCLTNQRVSLLRTTLTIAISITDKEPR